VGNLEEGGYTVVLSVCDHVCNTSSINWNFTVTSDQPCFIFADPCFVSSPQHTFVFRRACESVDLSSLRLMIEGLDSTGGYVTIISGAPVQSAGDSSWYAANIPNLVDFSALRLTLTGTFNGGAPLPTVTHVCNVDVFGPEITSVSPNPADTLIADEAQNFMITFMEQGGTTLNGPATVLRLTRDGNVIAEAGPNDITIDPAGTSGSATAVSPVLAVGNYILYAYVEDIAGNSTTQTWTYYVRNVVGDNPFEFTEGMPYTWPNPFPTTEENVTHFEIPITGDIGVATVQIKIYDFSGAFVALVYDGSWVPGTQITWAGVNESGEQVANGVYLAHVRLTAGGETRDDILKIAFKNPKN
jgi:hypothetical protein